MIEKACKTCKHLRKDCKGTSEPCLSWRASRTSLMVEIARLEEELTSKRRRRSSTRVRQGARDDRT